MVYGTGRKYSKGGGKHTYEILKRGGDEYEKNAVNDKNEFIYLKCLRGLVRINYIPLSRVPVPITATRICLLTWLMFYE